MKNFHWDEAKNKKLKKDRNISFEEILESLAQGGLLDTVEHPNKRKYPNQKMFVVSAKDYVYLVPFIETDQSIFLKTIIPNRKFLRKYQEKL